MSKGKKKKKKRIEFLRGPKVALRPVMKKDVPLFFRWVNDPRVYKELTAHLPSFEKDEEEWLENIRKSKDKNVVFTITVGGKAIGVMGIQQINHKDGTAITGAFIGKAKYRGKGYGSEAKMILLNYAFNTLNLRKISSVVVDFNRASLRYAEKCGYKEEGRRIKHIFIDGEYHDQIVLTIFREDWPPIWAKFQKECGEE